MPLNTEIQNVKNQIALTEMTLEALDYVWISLADELDYLQWLQGIVYLCHTGKPYEG